jgi:hypothetical protein
VSVGAVAAFLLGVAFLLAGIAKLAAGTTWRSQAQGMGAPAWSIRVLPWAELALGAALVTLLARRLAAVAALALLVAFTALIVRRLRAGEHPPCACFGAWAARPLGWGHVARNAALAALGLLALVG